MEAGADDNSGFGSERDGEFAKRATLAVLRWQEKVVVQF